MNSLDQPWLADTVPSQRFPVYTRSNISEVFPDPVTPLAATGEVWRGAEQGWRNGLVRFGAFEAEEFDPERDEMIGIFGGYGYLNVSVSRVMGVRMPGSNPDLIDQSYFGNQPGVPPYEERPGDVNPALTEKMARVIEWVLTTDSVPELQEYRTLAAKLRSDRPDFSTMTEKELADYAFGIHETYFTPWVSFHFFLIYAASVPVGGLAGLTAELGVPEVLPNLISGFGGVDSAAPSLAMWDLGRAVAASPALTTLFEQGIADLNARLREARDVGAVAAFVEEFDRFLYEFGSRGVSEWEMNTPAWQTHPETALAAIDRMRLADSSKDPRANAAKLSAERKSTAATVGAMIPDAVGRAHFDALLHAVSIFLPARERSKTSLVRMIGEVKAPLRELALRFFAAGHIDRPEDFAMVTRQEFSEFVVNPAAFSATIRERRARFDEKAALIPPFIVVGDVPPPSTWERRADIDDQPLLEGDVLKGVGACAGHVEGRARVIRDVGAVDDLAEGEILIAPQTDPSWTPLFVSSAAVVVDVGAPMSHAAIVSRELGIPCVVSCTSASTRIPNGAVIRVDGGTGTVTLVSNP